MPSNSKNDQSLSVEEMTGGVPLPQSVRPMKAVREVDKLMASANTVTTKSEVEPSITPLSPNTAAVETSLSMAEIAQSIPQPKATYGVAETMPAGELKPDQSTALPHSETVQRPTVASLAQIDRKITSDAHVPKVNLAPIDSDTPMTSIEDTSPVSWTSRFLKLSHLKSIFTRQRLRYIGIGLFSFGLFYLTFNYQLIVAQLGYAFNPPKQTASVTAPASSAAIQTNTAANQAEIVGPENLIVIPKINVNAPVVLEPSQDEKNIQAALQNGVVHYAGTALPGEPGNVVIVGHSSNDWWEPGNYKFVFAILDKVAVGDKIQMNYSSHKFVYQVTETKVVEPTDLSVLATTADPSLTVITCTPPGTSWKRLIVRAVQIEPAPAKPKAEVVAVATPSPSTTQSAIPLPGNAPSFFAQIGNFFSNIWDFFFHKPVDQTSVPTKVEPAQHLPNLQ